MFMPTYAFQNMKKFPYSWQRILYKLYWAKRLNVRYREGMEEGYIPGEYLIEPECGGISATRRVRNMWKDRRVTIDCKKMESDIITEKDEVIQRTPIKKWVYKLVSDLTQADFEDIMKQGSAWRYTPPPSMVDQKETTQELCLE